MPFSRNDASVGDAMAKRYDERNGFSSGLPATPGESNQSAYRGALRDRTSIGLSIMESEEIDKELERARAIGTNLYRPLVGGDPLRPESQTGDIVSIESLLTNSDPRIRATRNRWSQQIDSLKKQYPDAGFRSLEEIQKAILERAGRERAEEADIHRRTSGFLGGVSEFLGEAGAQFSDPLQLALLPVGPGVASGVLKTAVASALIGAGTEAVVQAAIAQGQDTALGFEVTPGSAILNMAAAAGGGAVFGGGLKLLGKGAAKAVNAYRAGRLGAKEAAAIIDEAFDNIPESRLGDIAEEMGIDRDLAVAGARNADILERNPFGDTVEGRQLHLDNVEKAHKALQADEPVSISGSAPGAKPPKVKIEGVEFDAKPIPPREPLAEPLPDVIPEEATGEQIATTLERRLSELPEEVKARHVGPDLEELDRQMARLKAIEECL